MKPGRGYWVPMHFTTRPNSTQTKKQTFLQNIHFTQLTKTSEISAKAAWHKWLSAMVRKGLSKCKTALP